MAPVDGDVGGRWSVVVVNVSGLWQAVETAPAGHEIPLKGTMPAYAG